MTEIKVKAQDRIALALPWCPWIPERAESRRRLLELLQIAPPSEARNEMLIGDGLWGPGDGPFAFREFTDKLPNDQWSEQVFDWLADSCADWCMEIQEDAIVPDNFWPVVRAILEAMPPEADIVGLHVCDPIAAPLAEDDVRIFTTADRLVGVLWAVRGPAMREFRDWRRTELVDGWREPVPPKGLPSLTEDTMMALFAMATGRRIYHPIPAPVDHDTSMASVWGNDDHADRRPRVSWKDGPKYGHAWDHERDPGLLEGAGFWMGRSRLVEGRNPDGSSQGYRRAHTLDPEILTGRARIPHVGRSYEATPALARRWVKGFGEKGYAAAKADTGDLEKRRLVYARRARASYKPRKRVLVCTPTRGGTDPRYTTSMLQLSQLFEFDVDHGLELVDSWRWHADVVRVRSRFVRSFLDTGADLLHFRDADVVAPPHVLLGMIKAEKDFVISPYPRRDKIDWGTVYEAAARGEKIPLEAIAYDYAIGLLPGLSTLDPQTLTTEIAHGPLGCSLISRDCLGKMVEYYAALDAERADLEYLQREAVEQNYGDVRPVQEEIAKALEELRRWRAGHMGLRFMDLVDGEARPTVAIFQLLGGDPTGPLASEDTSVCRRWRDMGGAVHLYLGPGSPADHVGEHVYEGKVEAFGLKRSA